MLSVNWVSGSLRHCSSEQYNCIPPGVKELNGKVERSHRIDDQYFYWRANCESFEGLNKSMKIWLNYYNEERPHGGLNYMTPKEKIEERMESLKHEKVEDKLIFMKNRYLIDAVELYLKIYKPMSFRRFKMAG